MKKWILASLSFTALLLNADTLKLAESGKTAYRIVYASKYEKEAADELKLHLDKLFNENLNFFSGMENPDKLGEYIEMANREESCEKKGLKFLNLLKRA